MADSACYIELASNAGDYFANSILDDIMIHPLYATQKILIGTSNGQAPSLTVTSNTIGVGTTTPAYKLDVNGDINFTGTLYKNGTLFSSGGGGQWSNQGANVFLLSSNVGIGVSNPSATLDVLGSMEIVNPNSALHFTISNNNSPYMMIHGSNGSLIAGATSVSGNHSTDAVAGDVVIKTISNSKGRLLIQTESGASAITVNSNNYVGIGTTTPTAPLHVNAVSGNPTNSGILVYNSGTTTTADAIVAVKANGATGGNPYLSWDIANVTGWSMGVSNADSDKFVIKNTFDFSATPRVTIDGAGNVGVGTTTPAYRFDVNANARLNNAVIGDFGFGGAYAGFSHSNQTNISGYGFLQQSTGITYVNSASGQPILFRENNVDKMTLSNGQLGIGTTSPAQRLDVAGNLRVQNNILQTLNDNTYFAIDTSPDVRFGFTKKNGFQGMLTCTSNAYIGFATLASTTLADVAVSNMTERMRIDGVTGNVSIGNTNNTYKLDVSGTVRATSSTTLGHDLTIMSNNAAWPSTAGRQLYMRYSTNGAGDAAFIQSIDRSTSTMYNMGLECSNLAISPGNSLISATPNLYVQFGGNVGVGTSNPGYKLDVAGGIGVSSTNVIETGRNVAGKEANAGKIGYQTFSTSLDIIGAGTSSTTRDVRVYDRLGVNTNPAYELDVNGTTKTTNLRIIKSNKIAYTQYGANDLFNAPRWFKLALIDMTSGNARSWAVTVTGMLSIFNESQCAEFTANINGENTGGQRARLSFSGHNFVSASTFDIVGYWNSGVLHLYAKVNYGRVSLTIETKCAVYSGSSATLYDNLVYSLAYTATNADLIAADSSVVSVSSSFSVNGIAEMVNVYIGGNTGIGTSSPSYKLDVTGNTRLNNALIGDSGHGVEYTTFAHSNMFSTTGYALLQHSSGKTFLNAPTGQLISFRINNSDQGGWTATGLGVGTTNPAYKLDVTGEAYVSSNLRFPNTATAGLYWGNGSSRIVDNGHLRISTDDNMYFQIGASSTSLGTEQMALTSTGLGVGNSSPAYKLDVTGTGRFTTGVLINNNQSLSFFDSGGTTRTVLSLGADNGVRLSSTTTLYLNPDTTATTSINYNNTGLTQIFTGTVPAVTVSNVNVGIGTITPVYKLDVNGITRITGGLYTNVTPTSFSADFQQAWVGSNGVRISAGQGIAASTLFQIDQFGGGTRMLVQGNGNIGLGTTSPAYTLDVTGTTRANTLLVLNGSNDGSRLISALDSSISATGQRYIVLGKAASINNQIEFGYNHVADGSSSNYGALSLYGTASLYWNGYGNVGIGTSSPTQKLEVAGNLRLQNNYMQTVNDNTYLAIDAGNLARYGFTKKGGFSGMMTCTSNTYMGFASLASTTLADVGVSNITERMRIDGATGNVSIANTNNTYRLDVTGTGRFTGDLSVDGDLVLSGNTGLAAPSVGTTGGSGDKIVLYAGTASAHPYSMGMNNFTMWSSVPNGAQHLWYTNGVVGMALSNNNLGIGTTSPTYRLDVSGTARANTLLILNGSNDNNRMISALDSSLTANGVRYIVMGKAASANNQAEFAYTHIADGSGSNYGSLGMAGGPSFYWNGYGNVGVGNSSPAYKFDVSGTGRFTSGLVINNNQSIQFLNSGGTARTIVNVDNFNNVRFNGASSTTSMYINPDNSGSNTVINFNNSNPTQIYCGGFLTLNAANSNVGIGTASPTYRLDVTGTTRFQNATPNIVRVSTTTNAAEEIAGISFGIPAGQAASIQGITKLGGGTDIALWTTSNAVSNVSLYCVGMSNFVGIGTTSPAYKLDVAGTARISTGSSTAVQLMLQAATHTSSGINSCLVLNTQGASLGTNTGLRLLGVDNNTGGGNFELQTNSTTRLTILNDGNVGIGTTSPTYKLDVAGNLRVNYNADSGIFLTGSTADINYAVQNTGTGGRKYLIGAGNNSSSSPGNFYIYDQTAAAFRINVNSSGQVGIGTVSPSYALHVVGSIFATGDIIGFSDKRLKSNINIIDSALAKLHMLNGYTFNIKDDDRLHAGLIAQEVNEVLPEVVHQEKNADGTDGYMSIAYGNMAGLFVEAIKEIDNKYHQKIVDLQQQVDKLQKELLNLNLNIGLTTY